MQMNRVHTYYLPLFVPTHLLFCIAVVWCQAGSGVPTPLFAYTHLFYHHAPTTLFGPLPAVVRMILEHCYH